MTMMESLLKIMQQASTDVGLQQYDYMEKECQILYVNGKESHVSVALSQMLPNFFNIPKGPNKQGDIFYQLQSFTCHNSFHNLISYYSLGLLVKFTIHVGGTINSTKTYNVPFIIPLNFGNQDRSATAMELAQAANHYIQHVTQNFWKLSNTTREILLQQLQQGGFTGSPGIDTIPPQNLNMTQVEGFLNYVLPNLKIIFDPLMQKFGIELTDVTHTIDVPISFEGIMDDNVTNMANLPYRVYAENQVKVEQIYCTFFVPTVSAVLSDQQRITLPHQQRIARYLGLQDYGPLNNNLELNITEDNLFGNVEEVDVLGQSFFTDHDFRTQFHSVERTNPSIKLVGTEVITYEDFHGYNSSKSYVKGIANLFKHNLIEIRSSLQTNFWGSDGRRNNVIAHYKVGQGIGQVPSENVLPTRIYQVRDTEDNVRGFTLEFFDADTGEQVIFKENYQLKIAFFFKKMW